MKKTHQQFLLDFERKGSKKLIICQEYNGCETPIEVKCKDCDSVLKITPHALLKGMGCPYCSGRKVDSTKNSFAIIHPEIMPFLVDKNKAYTVTKGSKTKCEVECPVCKTRHLTQYYILHKNGFQCSFCNKMTYPNKFLRLLLQSIPNITDLQFEVTFSINYQQKIRYDACFKYNQQVFVVEINGAQHYKNCSYNNHNVGTQQAKDLLKKNYATNQKMIYIEIDAQKSDFLYIKNQVLCSELSHYIDLSIIDWGSINQQLTNYSLLKEICLDYECNLLRVNELSDKYKLDRHCVTQYLRDGKELGLCPSYQSNANRQGVRVEAYDSEHNFIGCYPSATICAQELNKKFDLNFLSNSISHVLSGAQKSHRNFYFERGDYYE